MRLFRRLLVVPLVASAMLAVGALPGTAVAQQAITVGLGAGRDSSTLVGDATLTDIGGGKTRVVVRAFRANPRYTLPPDMPAHIHADACPGVGAVAFPLTNVTNGQSVTEVNASLSEILARGKSINLHQSPQEIAIYVACGNLPGSGPAAPPPAQLPKTGGASFGLYGLMALGILIILGGAGRVLGRRPG